MRGKLGRVSVALAVTGAWLVWSAAPALATTYTVANTANAGTGSLRAAVIAANSDASPPATIVFAPGVTGFIDLLSPLPPITQSVTIDGPGAATLELDGNGGQIQ